MNSLRGLIIEAVIRYIKENKGEEGYRKTYQQFPQKYQNILALDIRTMQWYPLEIMMHLLKSANSLVENNQEIYKEIGRYTCQRTFRGMFSALLEKCSPKDFMTKAPLIWRQLHDSGNINVEKVNENCIKMKIIDFASIDKSYCLYLIGYFEAVIEFLGGQDIKIKETKCRHLGSSFCEYELEWK